MSEQSSTTNEKRDLRRTDSTEFELNPNDSKSFPKPILVESGEGNVLFVSGDMSQTGLLSLDRTPQRKVHTCNPMTLRDVAHLDSVKVVANKKREFTVTNQTGGKLVNGKEIGPGSSEVKIDSGGSLIEVNGGEKVIIVEPANHMRLTKSEKGDPVLVDLKGKTYEAVQDKEDENISIFRVGGKEGDPDSNVTIRTRTYGKEKDAQTAISVINNTDAKIVVSDIWVGELET